MKYLTLKQAGELVLALEKYSKDFHALLIELMLNSGMRTEEVYRLKFSDLNEHNGTVEITGAKKSENRVMPISPELIRKIKAFIPEGVINQKDPIHYMITSGNSLAFKRSLQRYWERLRAHLWKGAVTCGLHGLRHTKALQIFESARGDPMAVKIVKVALGHKSLSSTDKYLTFFERESYVHHFGKSFLPHGKHLLGGSGS